MTDRRYICVYCGSKAGRDGRYAVAVEPGPLLDALFGERLRSGAAPAVPRATSDPRVVLAAPAQVDEPLLLETAQQLHHAQLCLFHL